MNLGNFNLRNLRQRDLAILAIVVTIAAALAWYFYMYRPTQDDISSLQNDIAQLETQIQRGEQARRNLPDLRAAVAQLEQDRRNFLAQLPKESDISGLIDQLRTSAAASKVTVNSFGQGNAQSSVQDVRPIGFTIATTGNFTDTMGFLGKLEALQRFTKIHQVGLSSNPDLKATFNFTVYVYTGKDPGGAASQ
ncbi:MAG: type 4a pilus biogenesis protein PilO [Deinococcales bacterium]